MSMECAHHQASFAALLDKQLNMPEQGALEEHLCNCHDCATLFAEHKVLGQKLSHYFLQAGSELPDLWSGLEAKLPPACELIVAELSAFLDGELTRAAQEGVRVHLKDCQQCLAQFRVLNTTNRLIPRALELPAKTKIDLWPQLRAQLNENCTLIASELSAFIDQEMPMQRHRDITVHILECPSCSDTVRSFSGVGELITSGYQPLVPENLNLLPAVTRELKVVPFTAKDKPKEKAGRIPLIAVCAASGFLMLAMLCVLAFAYSARPLISAEDYLVRTSFGRPLGNAEEIVYAH